jgi:hypothetical protein
MPRAGFEPAIPVTKGPQTYILDRAATGIGSGKIYHVERKARSEQEMLKNSLSGTVGKLSGTD